MRILLDECVPTRFAELLEGHEVAHVTLIGWSGVKNGDLLQRAHVQYAALITVDYELPSQLTSISPVMPVIVLHGDSNKLKHIRHLAPEVLELLSESLEKRVYRLGT